MLSYKLLTEIKPTSHILIRHVIEKSKIGQILRSTFKFGKTVSIIKRYTSNYLIAAAEAAAVVPENEPTPTACIFTTNFSTNN